MFNLEKSDIKKKTIIILVLSILSFGQFYNDRTKCIANKVGTGNQFSLFMLNMQFNGINLSEMQKLMGFQQRLMHYGNKVIGNQNQNYENHRCNNYFISKDICCRYSDLDNFTNKLIQFYKRTYFLSKHPMVDYIYKIYDQYKILGVSCLNNLNFNLPERNGYTKQNATSPLSNLINLIQNQIKMIKDHQINYIINTACIFCVGTLDLKTFQHPSHSDPKKSFKFIFNQQYFIQITQMVANKMTKAKQYADLIQNYIINTLRKNINNSSTCNNLTNMIFNDTQISKRKVCNTYDQCIKFAEKFIGDAAAPAYSKAFSSIQFKKTITATNFKLITTDKCGYKGNLTYERCQGKLLPKIYLKGNEYTYQ